MKSAEEENEKMDVLADKVATELRIGMDKHGVTIAAQWVSDLRQKRKLSFVPGLDSFLSQMTLGWMDLLEAFFQFSITQDW